MKRKWRIGRFELLASLVGHLPTRTGRTKLRDQRRKGKTQHVTGSIGAILNYRITAG